MKQSEFWPIVRKHYPRIEHTVGAATTALEMFAVNCFIDNKQGEDIDKIRKFFDRFRNCEEYFEEYFE